MFERRERVFASGSSSNHVSGTAHSGSEGRKLTCQRAGGLVAPNSIAQSTNITAATQPRAQTELARQQRFNLSKTHTYWWLEYACERGHFRFRLQRKKKRGAKNQANPQQNQYECGKCGWIINVLASNKEYCSEMDPAGDVDFDEGKTHSDQCAYAEPAPQDGQQHPQAAPNANAERDVAEVQIHDTRNNGGVVAKRDSMAVPGWAQRARIYEESTTTTTRTYFRTKEDYLDIKKALNGGNQ